MPFRILDQPGTYYTDTVPPGGSEFITFESWAPAGGSVDGITGSTGNSHSAGASEVFNVPAGATNVVMTAQGDGGFGGGGDGQLGGGGGGGGGKGVKNLGTFSGPITITVDGTGATADAGGGSFALGYNGTNGGSVTPGTGGTWSGDSGTDGQNGTAGGTPGPDADGGAGGDSGSGALGGAGGPGGHPLASNGLPGSNYGGGGGGGGGTTAPGTNGGGGAPGGANVTITWDIPAAGGGASGSGCYVKKLVELPSGERAQIVIPPPGTSGATVGLDAGPIEISVTTGGSGATLVSRSKGGLGGNNRFGGLGGDPALCIGDVIRGGSKGGNGVTGGGGGGGGGSPGTTTSGVDGDNAVGGLGGSGGVGGATGGAGGGNGGGTGLNGSPGNFPGAGSGGGGKDGGLGKDGGKGKVKYSWLPDPKWETSDCNCCDSTLWDNCSGTSQDWIHFDAIAASQDVDVNGKPNWIFSQTPRGFVPYQNYTFTATDWPIMTGSPEFTVDLVWIWDSMWTRPSGQQCRIKIAIWCDSQGKLNPFDWPRWNFMQNTLLPCNGTYQLNGLGYGPSGDLGPPFWPCAFQRSLDLPPDGSFAVFIESHPVVPGPEFFAEGHNITILGLVPQCMRSFKGGSPLPGGRHPGSAGGPASTGGRLISGGKP